jgi:hypothetical protein
LLSRSQGSGLPTTDASVSTRKACSLLLNCADLSAGAASAAQDKVATPVSWSSIFDLCPLCGEAPLETVRVDGQMACRSCTSSCTICSSPSVPGEEACTECLNHLSPQLAGAGMRTPHRTADNSIGDAQGRIGRDGLVISDELTRTPVDHPNRWPSLDEGAAATAEADAQLCKGGPHHRIGHACAAAARFVAEILSAPIVVGSSLC